MKKIFAFFLAAMLILSALCIAVSAEAIGEYNFIETTGKTAVKDVIFNVSAGKDAESLTLGGKTVDQGDGKTAWVSGFSSAEKNWIYDAGKGTLTLSQRYIATDIDLYGARELKFTLNYKDGTSENLTLKGVYNYVAVSANVNGYADTELLPGDGWRITASSALSSPAGYLDGDTATESHSYYKYDKTTSSYVMRYCAPHYVEIDTGKATEISGVRYVPRSNNSAGAWIDVSYFGSNDGTSFTLIGEDKYPGLKGNESITDFGRNVSYRYYRVKILSAASGYAVGTEMHLIKPVASNEDRKADVSSGTDAVWNIGSYGKDVSAVYIDDSELGSADYSISGGTFKLTGALISKIGVGEHAVKAVFSDSYMIVKLVVTNEGAALSSLKEKARAELAVFGSDAEKYSAEIMKKTTAEEIYAYLDEAEKALGAELVSESYGKKITFSAPQILYQSVSPEGEKSGDTDVVKVIDTGVKAVGLGRAVIKANGAISVIKVGASKIALVLISGQSNAAGDDSDYTLAPSATGEYEGRYFITNSVNLSRPVSDITKEDAVYTATNGGRPNISNETWSKNGVLHSAAAASQLGARLSDEWDMPVWVVNTAVCARIMQGFDPTMSGSSAYIGAVNYINKVKTLISEDAHFVLDESKTGMFWLQGESNGIGEYCTTSSMEEYKNMFMHMYNGLKKDIGINYCGIWLVRAKVTNSNSDADFEMSGPRLAQIYLTNSEKEEYKNIYLLLNTDLWRDGTKEYFEKRHPDAEAFKVYYGYDRPEATRDIKPGLHHSQKGYNELGDEAGEVISKILSGKTETVTKGYVAGFDGKEATAFNMDVGDSAYAVPMVKEPYYNVNAGLTMKIANEQIAVYDEESFLIKGVSEGTTEAGLYYKETLLATYPVSVTGSIAEDSVLSDRSKWTLEASSCENAGRDVKYLIDSDTSTSWTADTNKKLPDNEQWVIITLPEKTYVSGFSFSSYTDANGFPTDFIIYVDSGTGEFIKAAEGKYSRQNDYVASKKYDMRFDKNYPAKRVKFLFVNGHNGYAAMSEVYLTAKNTALSDYKDDVKLSISKTESGVYPDGTGVIRFITGIDKLPSGTEVEYYGSYAVKSAAFNENNMETSLIKKAFPESGVILKTGDTWALDITGINSINFDENVTAISFIKLKGDEAVYYSLPVSALGVDDGIKIEK